VSSELAVGVEEQRRLNSRECPPSAIEQGTFRANPLYELVLLDRLSPGERELLGELAAEDDLYGVLRPRIGLGLDLRSVSSDTALLFLTLGTPGPLPAYLLARLGDDLAPTIGRLVLDSVLEIEHAGEFVSGARALELVVSRHSEAGRGRIRALSAAALRYGQALAGLPAPLLAQRLYFYGGQPVSPALARRLPDAPAVAAYLGIAPGGSARAALDAGWHAVATRSGERTYWLTWRTRSRGRGGGDRSGGGYKLYVSPGLDGLETAVATVAGSLAGVRGVSAFKVGGGLDGICRPDKLVVYFDRLDDLQEGAARLRGELGGCPVHGVPFTAAITHDGLLSWGTDPPAAITFNGTECGSWRMWITERLAEYLVVARDGGPSEVEPWQFALERLRLCGIDTDTWVPASGMWPQALASA
jgi:hypothetical protein